VAQLAERLGHIEEAIRSIRIEPIYPNSNPKGVIMQNDKSEIENRVAEIEKLVVETLSSRPDGIDRRKNMLIDFCSHYINIVQKIMVFLIRDGELKTETIDFARDLVGARLCDAQLWLTDDQNKIFNNFENALSKMGFSAMIYKEAPGQAIDMQLIENSARLYKQFLSGIMFSEETESEISITYIIKMLRGIVK
jgi:hypothetical protein